MNHKKDICVYSPIVHCHDTAIRCKVPGEWEFWASLDECMISRCDEIHILCIPGWTLSTGVNAERKLAEKYGLPVRFVVLDPIKPTNSEFRYEITDIEPVDNYQPRYFS